MNLALLLTCNMYSNGKKEKKILKDRRRERREREKREREREREFFVFFAGKVVNFRFWFFLETQLEPIVGCLPGTRSCDYE